MLVYGLAAQSPNSTLDDALAEGRPAAAPGFSLDAFTSRRAPSPVGAAFAEAAANGRVDLDELRDTPVVLNFWASWCEPCREEAPVFRRGAARWQARGVLFLGLNMQDAPADARQFLREFKLDFPQVRDRNNATARAWDVTGLPETFFIGADAQVVGHVIGTVDAELLDAGAAAAKDGRPRPLGAGGEQRQTR